MKKNRKMQENNVVEVTECETACKKCKKGKKSLSPEQKKKRAIKAGIIVVSIVVVIGLFFGITAGANAGVVKAHLKRTAAIVPVDFGGAQLVPILDADGYWTFTCDRDLKVLQLTDVHIGAGAFSNGKDKMALAAVETMVRAEKPDLVILTGDSVYPVPFQAGTFNNLNGAKIVASLMESLGVYWTLTYGNHDTEQYSRYTRADISDFYENSGFEYCLFNTAHSSEDMGYGNNIIKVKNGSGVITQAIVTLDSHSYLADDPWGTQWHYDNVHESQVTWYDAEMQKLKAQNGGVEVKNLIFLHIPLVEYRDAWREYVDAGRKDTENVKYYFGVREEKNSVRHNVRTYGVCCGYQEDELFEKGLENGLQGVFCGHDHVNNFSIDYKGVRLTYGRSVDYLAYIGIDKHHSQRGCTVITVKTDGSMDVESKYYYHDYGVEFERR